MCGVKSTALMWEVLIQTVGDVLTAWYIVLNP